MTDKNTIELDLTLAFFEERIKRLIAQGDGSLSQELIRQWTHVVRIWTLAPIGTDASKLTNVDDHIEQPLIQYRGVHQFIVKYLQRDERHCALFEDAVTREGDLALTSAKAPYAVCEGFVFPYACIAQANDADIEVLLNEAWSWRLVGVLTTTMRLHSKARLQRSDFSQFVMDAQHIIVGAWSGDGIVVVDR